MTPDHLSRAELWSLREDVRVMLEPADGPLWLSSRWGDITIQRPSAVVREALRRMLLGPISLENVIGAYSGPADHEDAVESLRLLRQVLGQLQPLIIRTLRIDSGQPLLSVVPIAPHARFSPVPIQPEARVRLSTYAQLRTDGHEYRLESPLSLHRVLLHRSETLSLLGLLGRPIAADESVSAWQQHPPSLSAYVLAYLVATGMVICDDSAEDAAGITEDAGLAGWSPVDLMFHTRSNSGRHDYDVGVTYPMGSGGSPEPVTISRRAGGIALHRPTWEGVTAADPPLAVVMEGRRSVRSYGAQPVTAAELGDLLYRTARVRSLVVPPSYPDEPSLLEAGLIPDPRLSDRPYPGGGACYELELYVTVGTCLGISPGIYHYDPLGHVLEPVNADARAVDNLLLYAGRAAATSIRPPVLITITARTRRVSWKYEGVAYATVLKDVGVLLQNLYLVCTAMGLAPCALGFVNLEGTARAFGTDWRVEPSVGQFALGRAADTPVQSDWRWKPVNDAEWADYARTLLGTDTTGRSGKK